MKGLKYLLLNIVSAILLISFITCSLFVVACDCHSGNTVPQEINQPSDEPDDEPSDEPDDEPADEPVDELTEYRVHLILTCIVVGDNGQEKEITCTYGDVETLEDGEVYIVKLGENLTELQAATPPSGNTVGSNEYKFVGWYYEDANGEKISVDNNTLFTKEIFGDKTEISIKVKCERIFSPMMPL